MNKIINGKRYSTETARKLADYTPLIARNDFNFYEEALYITKSGNYFLHGEGGAGSKYSRDAYGSYAPGEGIVPLTYGEAREWAEKKLTVEEYEAIFGAVEELGGENDTEKINVTLPARIIKKLREKKEATGANISWLITKALQEQGY